MKSLIAKKFKYLFCRNSNWICDVDFLYFWFTSLSAFLSLVNKFYWLIFWKQVEVKARDKKLCKSNEIFRFSFNSILMSFTRYPIALFVLPQCALIPPISRFYCFPEIMYYNSAIFISTARDPYHILQCAVSSMPRQQIRCHVELEFNFFSIFSLWWQNLKLFCRKISSNISDK